MNAVRTLQPAVKRGRVLKLVRRIHMYLGLLLTPWVILYGVSGMLFNHPQLGRAIEQRAIDGASVQRTTGFGGLSPRAVAAELIGALNAQRGSALALDEGFAPRFFGWPLFATRPTRAGRDVVIVNLDTGAATVSRHAAPAQPDAPAFAEAPIALPRYQMAALAEPLAKLLAHGGQAPALKPHPEVAPELRLRAIDPGGRAWNLAWNMGSGAIGARAADEPGAGAFVELLAGLHTAHHFPVHPGIASIWALFADLTGLALVLWACTGLAMWWQMKPTRAVGVLALSLALGAAALVMTRMSAELQFVPPAREGGP